MKPDCIYLNLIKRNELLKYVTGLLPQEACGILAGKNNTVSEIVPVENRLHAVDRFMMAPEGQIKAMQWIESQQMDIIGFFHSHPNGLTELSNIDIQEQYYTEYLSIICSFSGSNEWGIQAYRVENNMFFPVKIEVSLQTKSLD